MRGWVKIHSFTEPRDNILRYRDIALGSREEWKSAILAEGRRHGKGLVARFDGVDDRDQAAGLVGEEISVRRSQLPADAEGGYYWSDLIGLEVVNMRGQRLGTVDRLIETGANDVLVVQGDRERLIPFVRDSVISAVDLDHGRIVVDWEADY